MHYRQVVATPIHIHGNVLDLILTDCAENITNLVVHPFEYQCISSDHNLITFNFNCEYNNSKTVPRETFNYNKGDYIGLNDCLLTCDFSVLYNMTDPEEMWITLKEHILTGMNLFIILKVK